MTTLLVIGSSNVDHVMHLKRLPQAGESYITKEYQIQFGGKGANQAIACARLSNSFTSIQFITALGDDSMGQNMLNSWKKEGLHLEGIHMLPNEITGSAMVFIDEQGENCIAVNPGANGKLAKSMLDEKEALFEKASHVLLQLEIPIDSVNQALKLAKKHQCQALLNPAPARELSPHLLSLVDIITPNETEAYILTGIKVIDNFTAQQAADQLHDAGVKCVIITLGQQGAYVSDKSMNKQTKGLLIPTTPITPIDTVAAGDTFNGALMTGLAENMSLNQAIQFANQAAGITVTRHGAQKAIPKREELLP